MIKLYDTDTDALIGEITPQQLQFLIDRMEEESTEDRDYYIDEATLTWFEGLGADADLIALLRKALGNRSGIEIRWQRTAA
jgi:hypothetical protein